MNNSTVTEVAKPHTTQDIIFLIIYALILIIGLLGNSLIICYFGFKTKSKQLFHHYLLHLAIADLFACVTTSSHYMYNVASQSWHLGIVSCKIVSSLGPLTVNVSAWIITTIAIERNRGISSPLKKRFGKRWIQIVMACIWVASIITLIPYTYSMTIEHGQCRPIWRENIGELSYALVTLFIQSIIPSIMMVFIFLNIRKSIKQRVPTRVHYQKNTRESERGEKPNTATLIFNRFSRKRRSTSRDENKLLVMLATAFLAFIACSLPYNIFYVFGVYATRFQNKAGTNLTKANIWLSTFVVMNSCLNFFIYAGLDRNFTQFCKSLIMQDKKRRRSRGSTLSSNLSYYVK